MLRYVRTLACRAVAQSLETPAGVVHLNLPFREPLVPSPADGGVRAEDEAFGGRADGQPFVRATPGPRVADPHMLARLANELASIPRGLILAGPQTDPSFPTALAALSAALGYPVLADPLSQVRCGPHDRHSVIDAYDAFLPDASVVERLAPRVLLRFGMPPPSNPLLLYLRRYVHARQIVVDDDGAWNDASKSASDTFQANASSFCASLTEALPARNEAPAAARW